MSRCLGFHCSLTKLLTWEFATFLWFLSAFSGAIGSWGTTTDADGERVSHTFFTIIDETNDTTLRAKFITGQTALIVSVILAFLIYLGAGPLKDRELSDGYSDWTIALFYGAYFFAILVAVCVWGVDSGKVIETTPGSGVFKGLNVDVGLAFSVLALLYSFVAFAATVYRIWKEQAPRRTSSSSSSRKKKSSRKYADGI